jgi:hypothetical protein
MTTFIIGNGLNTSYIDSLIMALFYKSSCLRYILIQNPENSKFMYLQELIDKNFIKNIDSGNSIDPSFINEIRNYSNICGWKEHGNITDLYSVLEYLKFLMAGIGFGNMDMDFIELNNNNKIKTISMNYIFVQIIENTDVKILLESWYYSNIKKIAKKNKTVYNKFRDIPIIIPIYFSREQGSTYKVDIKKKIKFKNNNDCLQNKACWVIHSIICFSNSGTSNYYSILNTGLNNWYMFSNDNIPSLTKIKITDPYISEKIKQECVLALYIYDEM